MSENTNSLAVFTTRVNNLIESKLILIDKPITSLLKCVASIPEFTQCIVSSLEEVSYVQEFKRARVQYLGNDNSVRYRLNVPQDKRRLFAFVVCLLTEVDDKRRNLVAFLDEYFESENTNESLSKFIESIIKPFRRAGENILRNIDPESLYVEPTSRPEKYFQVEKSYVSTPTLSLLKDKNTLLTDLTVNEHYISKTQRDEMLLVVEAFNNALLIKNGKLIKVLFIACKNTLISPKQQAVIKEISKVLSDCNLI